MKYLNILKQNWLNLISVCTKKRENNHPISSLISRKKGDIEFVTICLNKGVIL